SGKSIVESKELIIKQIIRDKVRDKVMERNQNCMVLFSNAEKSRSNQRAIHYVKRPASMGRDQGLQTVIPVFYRKFRNFHPFQRDLKLGSYNRPRLTINFRHRCPEILVAAHQFIDGLLQGDDV